MDAVLQMPDCTEMTKIVIRKIQDSAADAFYYDIDYKMRKGEDYSLFI